MKILFVNTWMHSKNENAIMNYKNIDIIMIKKLEDLDNYNLNEFNVVYSPSDPIDVNKYEYNKFLFGPHFSAFPTTEKVNLIVSNKSTYLMPSQWCIDLWKMNNLCKDLNIVSCPFGVDTERFNETMPIQNRNRVFIYFKGRNPQELFLIENILRVNNIEYRVFSYRDRYDENEYIEYLQSAKYGIWLDAHESQGFALEEALSCNVPLLVWSVTSMNQEYGQNYSDIPATTIPYWDNRCGEVFYKVSEFGEKINLFLSKLNMYKPREFILGNLSMNVCEQKLIDLIENINKGNL